MGLRACLAALFIILVVALAFLLRARSRATQARGFAQRETRGGAAQAALRWEGPRACYPPAMIAEGLRAVRRLPGYGPVNEAGRRQLAAEAARLGAKYGRPFGAPQLEAMRRTEVALAAQRRGGQAARLGGALAAAHAAGESVLALAARHDLPPLAVLRAILAEGGRSPAQVRAAVADPALLPPALAREAPAIHAADEGSRQNAERVRAEAQAYEDAVGAHLRARGLDFETEEDLRARGVPLTPDFLFRAPVLIDGRPVRWLDAKNYGAFDSPLTLKGLKKQAAKYTARFGPGAMVFGGGVMCGSKTARLGALVLDGTHLSSEGSASAA